MRNKIEFDMITESTNNHIPQLRFPEFQNDGEWEAKRLGEIITVNSGRDYKHLNQGDIPVYGTGGYMLSVDDKLSDIDAIGIGRKGTIDKPQFLKAPFWTVDTLFFLTTKDGYDLNFVFFLFQTIEWKKYSEQTGVPSLTRNSIEKIEVKVPPLAEQRRIAACLSALDEVLAATNEKLEQLKAYKKGMMQKLFPAKGKKLPELRFKEFEKDGEWVVCSLETIFEIKNGYTPSKANPKFWEKGTLPWFRMEDIRLNGHILSDSIQHITPEAVKGSGLFPAYSIIVATTATIGEHALLIVDSLANQRFTFLTKCKSFDEKLDMMYFHYYMFIVDEWCKCNTNSGGLLSLNMPAFKKLRIPYPSNVDEQRKIADSFTSIDEMIKQYTNKVTFLELYKKGMMQQMFPTSNN